MTTRTEEIAQARQVDETIAAAWDLYWAHEFHALNDLARQAERDARTHGYSDEINTRRQARAVVAREKANAVQHEAELLRKAAQDLDAKLYGGWNRFFLVQHIHSSQSCSSFRPTTKIGWLPYVSGLTEAEAVAEHGATLCTICFPSAPTELTVAKVDPSTCPGSGQTLDSSKLTGRENAYYSPSGTCRSCGQVVGLTSRNSGRVRKHKAA